MRASVISAAVVAALVGFGSTVALVLAAAAALGATPAQTASWLLAVSLAKALGSAGLSYWTRVPVVLAWSTPGAALIATSTGLGMAEAVGGFLLAGLLVILTGLVGPLGRLIGRIPDGIAAAMLAGVLLPFALKIAPAAATVPALVLPMAAVFLAVRLWHPAWAVLAALATGVGLAFATGQAQALPRRPRPAFADLRRAAVQRGGPDRSWPAALSGDDGLAEPARLCHPARGRIRRPGPARAGDNRRAVGPVRLCFGGHTVNMAAITAAICLGDDVHPDRDRRWQVGLAYGAMWVVLGVLSPWVIALIGALPAPLIAGLVGLALLAPLTGALAGAYALVEQRFAASVTLAIAASGMVAFGVGAAFWGLLAGLLVLTVEAIRRRV